MSKSTDVFLQNGLTVFSSLWSLYSTEISPLSGTLPNMQAHYPLKDFTS